MDGQFGIASRARSSLQEMTNDFQRALTANGYLRGRGIRMRLLHHHICAISGAPLLCPVLHDTPTRPRHVPRWTCVADPFLTEKWLFPTSTFFVCLFDTHI